VKICRLPELRVEVQVIYWFSHYLWPTIPQILHNEVVQNKSQYKPLLSSYVIISSKSGVIWPSIDLNFHYNFANVYRVLFNPGSLQNWTFFFLYNYNISHLGRKQTWRSKQNFPFFSHLFSWKQLCISGYVDIKIKKQFSVLIICILFQKSHFWWHSSFLIICSTWECLPIWYWTSLSYIFLSDWTMF